MNFKKDFPRVFSLNRSRCIEGIEALLVLKDNPNLYFHKAYAIPFAIKDVVGVELDSMVEEVILIPKRQSGITNPKVVVP